MASTHARTREYVHSLWYIKSTYVQDYLPVIRRMTHDPPGQMICSLPWMQIRRGFTQQEETVCPFKFIPVKIGLHSIKIFPPSRSTKKTATVAKSLIYSKR